jgi:hypothetical protein
MKLPITLPVLACLLLHGHMGYCQAAPAQLHIIITKSLFKNHQWDRTPQSWANNEYYAPGENPKKMLLFSYPLKLTGSADTLIIKKPGTFTYQFPLDKPELLDLYYGPGRVLLGLRPGMDTTIELQELVRVYYSETYRPPPSEYYHHSKVGSFWSHDLNTMVAELDSAAYNRRIENIRRQADKYLEDSAAMIPAWKLQNLRRYNQYIWGWAYIQYAQYRRALEPVKQFNFTDSNYLEPLYPLLYSVHDMAYSTFYLDEIIKFYKKLRRVNFETRLFEREITGCGRATNGHLNAYMNGTSCMSGYKLANYWVVPALYETAEGFRGKHAIVSQNGLYGLVNSCGDVIIKPAYDKLSWLDEKLLVCSREGLMGLINVRGKMLIEPQYASINLFSGYAEPDLTDPGEWLERHVLLARHAGTRKTGVIDSLGNIIVPFEYDDLGTPFPGFLSFSIIDSTVYSLAANSRKIYASRYGVMTTGGKIIIPLAYQSLQYRYLNKDEPFFLVRKINYFKAGKAWENSTEAGSKAYDRSGKLLFHRPVYEFLTGQYGGIQNSYIFAASAKMKDPGYHIFDRNGNPYVKDSIDRFSVYDGHLLIRNKAGKLFLLDDANPSAGIDSFDTFTSMHHPLQNRWYRQDDEPDDDRTFYIGCRDGKCAILDENFRLLSGFLYDDILSWKKYKIVRQNGRIHILDSFENRFHPVAFDTLSWLTHYTYQAKAGNDHYVFSRDFAQMIRVNADEIFLDRSSSWKDTAAFSLLNGKLVALKGDFLYKISPGGDSAAYTKIVPGRKTIATFFSRFYRHIFVLNEKGLIIYYKKESNGYTYETPEWDLVKSIFIDADRAIVPDRNQKVKLVNIATGAVAAISPERAEPVYEETSAEKELVIYGNGIYRLPFKTLKYYAVTMPSRRAGLLDTAFDLRLDTVYSSVSALGEHILAHTADPVAAAAGTKELVLTRNGVKQTTTKAPVVTSTVAIFNKHIEQVGRLENVTRLDRERADIIKVTFQGGREEVFRLLKNSVISMECEDIHFQDHERIYWVKRKGSWYLLDNDGRVLSSIPYSRPAYFTYGIAGLHDTLLVRNGAFIQNNEKKYAPQPLSINLRELLFRPLSDSAFLNLRKTRRVTDRKMENLSPVKFSKYVYQGNPGGKKTDYEYVFELADDPRYPEAFINAVNLAFIRKMHNLEHDRREGNDNLIFKFSLYSDKLFRLTKLRQSYYGDYLEQELLNNLLIHDTLFQLNGSPDIAEKEFSRGLWGDFNQLFYSRLSGVSGLSSKGSYCANPARALSFYQPVMGISNDSVTFIITRLEVYGKIAPVYVSFSYAEVLPYLDKTKLLYRWIRERQNDK